MIWYMYTLIIKLYFMSVNAQWLWSEYVRLEQLKEHNFLEVTEHVRAV